MNADRVNYHPLHVAALDAYDASFERDDPPAYVQRYEEAWDAWMDYCNEHKICWFCEGSEDVHWSDDGKFLDCPTGNNHS